MALKMVKGSIDRMFDKNLQDLVRGIRNHKEDEVSGPGPRRGGVAGSPWLRPGPPTRGWLASSLRAGCLPVSWSGPAPPGGRGVGGSPPPARSLQGRLRQAQKQPGVFGHPGKGMLFWGRWKLESKRGR